MDKLISEKDVLDILRDYYRAWFLNDKKFMDAVNAIKAIPSAESTVAQERYEDLCEYFGGAKDILNNREDFKAWLGRIKWHIHKAEELYEKYEQEPKTGHYEKHIDHTDCIWYGSDSGCPFTCSQYRDGWNDAMDYIFKNGKGYQPYRHDG